jgi:Ca-dependent carbohydrate-binding module xylan-binding/Right handed beta helix region
MPQPRASSFSRCRLARATLLGLSLMAGATAASAAVPIVVSAKSTVAGGVGALMVVYVNGAIVSSQTVQSLTYANYTFWAPDSLQQGGRVDVQFANDAVVGGVDRNLWVQSISVNGSTINSNASSVRYDRGGPSYALASNGADVVAGQIVMPWNGALRFTVGAAASSAAKTTTIATVAAAPVAAAPAPSGTTTPNPWDFDGQPARVGQILITQSNTTISNARISNPGGDCIVIRPGVTNVTIRNVKIGPCGSGNAWDGNNGNGVRITGAHNTTVERAVFTGVSAGVYADYGATGVQVRKSHFSQLWGGETDGGSKGNAVQLNSVTNGSGRNVISCNVIDNHYGSGSRSTGDVISLFKTSGTQGAPVEIAYNKIRGGNAGTGSGIMIGDHAGSWTNTHDNILVLPSNVGIGVAGGTDHRVVSNRVWALGSNYGSKTCSGFYAFGQASQWLGNVTVANNRSYARCWLWGGSGEISRGWYTDGNVGNLAATNNNFIDTSLQASIWDEKIAACQ